MPELDHTISALIRKRAEIAGQIEYHQAELRRAVVDLDRVEHTLRLFSAGRKFGRVKPKPYRPDAAPRGEVKRHIVEALRAATESMTGAELAAVVLERRGIPTAAKSVRDSIKGRTRAPLCELRGRGLVVSEKGENGLLAWRLR